jgi:DNA-binding NarL/FixJ family response regulator
MTADRAEPASDQAHRPNPIRALIVDDHAVVRQELRSLLPLAGEIEIVGEAADGLEAIRLVQVLQP